MVRHPSTTSLYNLFRSWRQITERSFHVQLNPAHRNCVCVMSLFRVTCCPLMTSFHSLGEELRISPHKLQLRLSSFEWQVDRSVLALSPRLTRNETICDCLASKQDIENKNTPRRRPDPSNILGREDQQRETFEMNLHFIRFGQSCFLLGILLVHLNHSIIGQIIGQTVRSG